ncbi:DUF7948 domain-containing protein [Fulvivirga ligni]|uniref:DUF7948 domain-containing protein n=1 Tax=Fulvivirga ligni TaxID=2904246 RepID=UPI001F400828|nr:PKD domain-containing protein [Fulvivirga ligni]UII20656.1 PKD domain-containing protein [Fulvivirga ligni]
MLFFFVVSASFAVADVPAIKFIENRGQWRAEILFKGTLPEGEVYFLKNRLVYTFYNYDQITHTLSHDNVEDMSEVQDESGISAHSYFVDFIGANQQTEIQPANLLKTKYNFYVGDSSQWRGNVNAYDQLNYNNLYDGVDLQYKRTGNTVKYDLRVEAGYDPASIQLRYNGAMDLSLSNGRLKIKTSVNEVLEERPYAYQYINGNKEQVACQYVLNGDIVSFTFPLGFDECYDLIIDPTLIFSTYSGSTADNWGSTATYDESGNLYSGGIAINAPGNFPATAGAYQVSTQGLWDIAILKYDSVGSNLIYATYLGGNKNEVPQSMIVNDQNELYVMGVTSSSNYPVSAQAYQNSFAGGNGVNVVGIQFSEGSDIIITKFNASGSGLLGSTFIGGSANDGIMLSVGVLSANYGDQSRGDIYINQEGDILVASKTFSNDFDVVNSVQDTLAGSLDAVVFKMDPDLTNLKWSTYLGGTFSDAFYSVKTNSFGEIIVAGGTNSDSTALGVRGVTNVDGWIVKFAEDGSTILGGTYVGKTNYDQVYFIDVDADDFIYTFGQTNSVDFDIKGDVYNVGDGQFLQKYSSDLTALEFSTTFGSVGNGIDISPTAFLVNDCDNIYLSGWGGKINQSFGAFGGSTIGMPITSDAYQSETLGSDFYLMALSGDASELLYATFLGGNKSATHVDGGTSRFDKSGIVYHAVCAGCQSLNVDGKPTSDFPPTPGAWSETNNSGNCNNAAFKFDLASLRARLQTNSIDFDQPGLNKICFPSPLIIENLSVGGEVFEWNFGDGNSLTTSDTDFITHDYGSPGRYTITLKAIDPTTCIGEDFTSYVVDVFEKNMGVGADGFICEEDSYRLQAFGGVEYFWISNDSSFTSTEARPVVSPVENTIYTVFMIDVNGCSEIAEVKVDVTPKVNISFQAAKEYDCFSRPILHLENNSTGGADYRWSLGDGQTLEGESVAYEYSEDGTYEIKLSGQNENCPYDSAVTLDFYDIKVPNVITPGAKGDNDYFQIITGPAKKSLKIYNRWGKKIYESSDYQNDWQGADISSGVYYYEADIEGETTCNGWIHVIK